MHWALADEDSSRQKYYLVNDLHIGGNGALQHCDYSTEFIEFLKGLHLATAPVGWFFEAADIS